MGRSVFWCGNGCQRFLIDFFLGHVEFGCKLTERSWLGPWALCFKQNEKNGALWLKRFPYSRYTEMAIEMLFLTPGSDLFFEFREPRFLWRGALFGAEVAASDC
jgi:hypothetical protein